MIDFIQMLRFNDAIKLMEIQENYKFIYLH